MADSEPLRIGLAGAGKMGGALLAGWLEQGLPPSSLVVFEPAPGPELTVAAAKAGWNLHAGPSASESPVDVLVLAIKPQIMPQALPYFRPLIGPHSVAVSIAAGRPLAFLESMFGERTPIVRAMPNTPASIGRGITVACANAAVDRRRREQVEHLLAAVGEVGWVEDERLIDAVTAVSGSGPAYVFLLTECLAKAGCDAGLPSALAERLARATVAGAGEMLHQSKESAATLRQNVTSPGGTTEAALKVLMDADGLERLLGSAVERATARSRELAR